MPTVRELGAKVKLKYPGEYDDLDDVELGRRVRTKYPEYSDFTDEIRDARLVPQELGGTARVRQEPLSFFGMPLVSPASNKPVTAGMSTVNVVRNISNKMDPALLDIKNGLQTALHQPGRNAPRDRSRMGGVHQALNGALALAEPMLPVALAAAPVATAVGVPVSMGARALTTAGAKALGVEEGASELAGDVAGMLIGYPALKAVAGRLRAKPSELEQLAIKKFGKPLQELGQGEKLWIEDILKNGDRAVAGVDYEPKGKSSAQQSAEVFGLNESAPFKSAAESAEVFNARLNSGRKLPGGKSEAASQAQRRAQVQPPVVGEPESQARVQDQIRNIAQSIFGTTPEKLSAEDFATVGELAKEGYGSALPKPELEGPRLNDFGGAVADMVSQLRKPKAKQLMNFDKLNVSPAEELKLRQGVARAALENKIDPFEVEPMEAVVDAAKKMGLPTTQNTVQQLKDLGIKSRASVYALRQQINSLNKSVIDAETKLMSGNLSDSESQAISAKRDQDSEALKSTLNAFTGVSTEFGRNLNAFKLEADSTWDVAYWLGKAKRQGGGFLDDGAAGKIRGIIAEGEAATTPVAKAAARTKLAELVAKRQEHGLGSTVMTLVRAGYLSNPVTHMRNILGNAMFNGMEQASKTAAVPFDVLQGMVTDRRTVTPAQTTAVAKGLIQNRNNPARYEGMLDTAKADTDAKYGGDSVIGQWVANAIDKISKPVFWALGKEDFAFKKLAAEQSVNEQANLMAMNEYRQSKAAGTALPKDYIAARAKELSAKPTDSMQLEAIAAAEFTTFNNENKASNAVKGGKAFIRHLADKESAKGEENAKPVAEAIIFGFDSLVPFVRTPTNVVARTIDYSVGAPLKTIATFARVVNDTVHYKIGNREVSGVKLGNALGVALTPQRQKAISMAFGRGSIGTALTMLGYYMWMEDKATGPSKNDQQDRGLEKMRGASPGSLLIDGKWRQVNPFAPGGSLVTIGIGLAEKNAEKIGQEAAKRPDAFFKNLAEQNPFTHPVNAFNTAKDIALPTLMEMPMIKGIGDTYRQVMQGGDMSTGRRVASQVASFIPYSGLVGEIASATDPRLRETGTDDPLDAAGRGILSRLPAGMGREELPPRVDALARPVPTSPFDPFRSTPDTTDVLTKEMSRLKVGGTGLQYHPKESLKHFERRVIEDSDVEPKLEHESDEEFVKRAEAAGYKRADFSRDEHVLIEELAGSYVNEEARALIEDEDYKSSYDIDKGKMLAKQISDIRKEINGYVSGEDYQAMSKQERLRVLTDALRKRGLRK